MSKNDQEHYAKLKNMYDAAPIHGAHLPNMMICEGRAEAVFRLSPDFFHSAGALHGAVYFKLLDDTATMACSSLESSVLVVTCSFTIYITRPTSDGSLRVEGRVLNQNKTQFIVESVAYDDDNREVARGSGLFMRSKVPLTSIPSYRN